MSKTISERNSVRTSLSSFSKKTKVIGAVSLILLLVTGVVAQSAGTKAVSLGSDGIDINLGELDMNGNDIVSGATTIWDASAGQVPASVIDYSGATASDVGLDNVQNEAQVSEYGDNMTGEYNLNGSLNILDSNQGFDKNALNITRGSIYMGESSNQAFLTTTGQLDSNNDAIDAFRFKAYEYAFETEQGQGCDILVNGTLECVGSKNWVHSLNKTHEAVYSSQESPEVRAVYEGQTTVNNGKVTVELPNHFEKTVSDSRPSLRVQATPHELATVAVTERSNSQIIIEATKDVKVDYRVTGIREGYEDREVVREK